MAVAAFYDKSRILMFGNCKPHFYLTWTPHKNWGWTSICEKQLTPAFHSVLFSHQSFFYCNKKLTLPELTALFHSPLLNLIWTKINEQTLKHSRFTMAVGPGSLVCREPSCWKSFYGGSYTLVSLLILEEQGSVCHNKHERKRVHCLLRWCFLCKHGGSNSLLFLLVDQKTLPKVLL